jgi:hypothetical protein
LNVTLSDAERILPMRKLYLLPAALLLPAWLLLLAAPALPAQELRVEAERYTDSRDLSQLPIEGVDNPSCSGGVSLVGLDSAGEWTAYEALVVPAAGNYAVSVHYRAQKGKPVLLRLTLAPEGEAGAPEAAGTTAGTTSVGTTPRAPAAAEAAPREIELSLPGNGFG